MHTTAAPTTIQSDFILGRQSVELVRVVRVGDVKVKVHIDRDSYDFQSSAVAFAWTTEAGWKPVISVPIERTRAFAASYVDRNPRRFEADFNLDADDLIDQALAVLL